MEDKIRDGEFLILQRGDQQRMVLFQAQQTVVFGKGQTQQDILLKNALGQPYYSAFRIVPVPPEDVPAVEEFLNPSESKNGDDGNQKGKGRGGRKGQWGGKKRYHVLEKVDAPASKTFSQLTFEASTPIPAGKDNRNIFDDRSSQPLGQSDIHSLKDQGLSSKEILTTIISSSKSFARKTEFSQEKYLKKKEKVHGDLLLFLKTDLFLVAEYYFKKDPVRVLGLRPDTLSQILSYGNVHSGGRYIVYENACGLLVGAALERMGGEGLLLHCHAGTNPQRQALSFLNLNPEELKPLRGLDVFYLIKGRGGKAVTEEESAEPLCKKPKKEENLDEVMEAAEEAEEDSEIRAGAATPAPMNREYNEVSLKLLEMPFHSLIICGKEHPLSILQRLMRHLLPSSPFVVFSAFPEPLIECYMWVKEKGCGANMNVVDNWMRNIQVESERTHPEINMSSSGGYILYGNYVQDATSS